MTMTLQQLVSDVRSQGPGAMRAAGRLMSLMENQPQRLAELIAATAQTKASETGQSREHASHEPRLILGVTGAPGSGKSTLVDQMVADCRKRYPDRRIGVIAVDPSSPFTGGAVLGDRVRMMRHASDPMVFVRSLASRGHLGGLSLGVKGIVRVMGLIGCDIVFIETVGVGQSEIEIARLADQVMIILAPGQGDSVQLLKAGLMEIGDWFVINKADLPGAQAFHAAVESTLQMGSMVAMDLKSHAGQADMHADSNAMPDQPELAMVCASQNQGVAALMGRLEEWIQKNTPSQHARRSRALRDDVRESLLQQVRKDVLDALAEPDVAAFHIDAILQGKADVASSAKTLLQRAAACPE